MIEIAVALMTTLSGIAAAPPPSAPVEMQARQQGGAMTPQRARRECWQSLGFAPNTPRNQYPSRLLPQVESCIAQKMRR
ncbi:MAG: hypothetical protein JNK84_05405 [Phreatobacter sp.]|uniref:hypothetical protein n=1 Tax=Phreatobacter sp. TaxID=1966341 RepID=UPI001A60B053|nr:hypothetical protein [Phreatobacter sp.]MBL8568504.1 hypothetical protein [Phreatobacter sp.]